MRTTSDQFYVVECNKQYLQFREQDSHGTEHISLKKIKAFLKQYAYPDSTKVLGLLEWQASLKSVPGGLRKSSDDATTFENKEHIEAFLQRPGNNWRYWVSSRALPGKSWAPPSSRQR